MVEIVNSSVDALWSNSTDKCDMDLSGNVKLLSVEFGSVKKQSSLEARSLLTNLASHLKCRLDGDLVSCQDAQPCQIRSGCCGGSLSSFSGSLGGG